MVILKQEEEEERNRPMTEGHGADLGVAKKHFFLVKKQGEKAQSSLCLQWVEEAHAPLSGSRTKLSLGPFPATRTFPTASCRGSGHFWKSHLIRNSFLKPPLISPIQEVLTGHLLSPVLLCLRAKSLCLSYSPSTSSLTRIFYIQWIQNKK